MDFVDNWRRRAGELKSAAAQRVHTSVARNVSAVSAAAGDAYAAALNWKNNSEFSNWLTDHLSHQYPTIASRAMDAEYIRTHIGGSWHRLYDGGHTLTGSWNAIAEALPDADALNKLATWANEYWKDLITVRGMPIVLLDHTEKVSEYFKHFDCVNVAELIGADLFGVSIYCNWDDPAKLVASAAATDCSAFAYANIVSPLVSVIALGRAYFLMKRAEQEELQSLISPALRGLTRSGSTILLIGVVPGGFLLHLSCGIVLSLAHNFVWEKTNENKETIFAMLVTRLNATQRELQALHGFPPGLISSDAPSTI
jgi:hypothetical protein